MKKLILAMIAGIVVYVAWPRHGDAPAPTPAAPIAANPQIAAAIAAAREATKDLPPSTPPDIVQPADLPAPGLPAWSTPLPGQTYELPVP